jgi:hypothetical protein
MSPKTLFFSSLTIALIGIWLLFGHWPVGWNDRFDIGQFHALLELARLIASLLFLIAIIGYLSAQVTRFSRGITDGPLGIRDNPWLTSALAATTPFVLISIICVGYACIINLNSFKSFSVMVLAVLCWMMFHDMSKRVFPDR